jgi:hypothetical protein
MNRLCTFCVSLCWFILPAGAQEGERPSHDFGNKAMSPKDVSKFLDQRRGRAGANAADIKLLQKMIEKFGAGDIDPKAFDPEMIKKFIEANPQLQDPKNLERLREFVQKEIEKEKENPQWDPEKIKKAFKQLEEFREKHKEEFEPKKDNPMPPQVKEEPKPKKDIDENKDDRKVNQMKKWVKKNFGDSPALKNLAQQFSDRLNKAGNRKLDWMPKMKKDWLPNFDWFKRKKTPKKPEPEKAVTTVEHNNGGGFKIPDRPRLSMPEVRGPSLSRPSFGVPGEGGIGANLGIFSFIILLLVGVAIWYYYLKPAKVAPAPAVLLPTPPIDLLSLASRQDVILAFEFLSVVKCGAEAKNWHHKEIATKLGEVTDVDAASGLAQLYEKARYTPENELFTDADLAAARQNVRTLAPGSTA